MYCYSFYFLIKIWKLIVNVVLKYGVICVEYYRRYMDIDVSNKLVD